MARTQVTWINKKLFPRLSFLTVTYTTIVFGQCASMLQENFQWPRLDGLFPSKDEL